jgi:hypothetical protein
MGCTHVILWFNFGWLTHREVTAQMELFANEVMPHFQPTNGSPPSKDRTEAAFH